MKTINYWCDKCGKEMDRKMIWRIYLTDEIKALHFCEKCYDEVLKGVKIKRDKKGRIIK